jgi:3-oxoadipate enol-lactonase
MPHAVGYAGARIYYEVHGTEGPHVVLLQGLGLSSRLWFDIPRRLAVDAHEPYRAIILDNRGTGRSARPRGRYRVPHMADDVAAVLDAAGASNAFVVGISMGGMIAQEVALRHRLRVRGLALLATSAGLPHVRLPRLRTIATLLALPILRPQDPRPALAELLLSQAHRARALELLAEWPAAMFAEPTPTRAVFAQMTGVFGHSTGFRLRQLSCPTVVVTGADDALVPASNSRILAQKIRGAELEVIPDCGHGITVTHAEVVQRALARLRRPRAP